MVWWSGLKFYDSSTLPWRELTHTSSPAPNIFSVDAVAYDIKYMLESLWKTVVIK